MRYWSGGGKNTRSRGVSISFEAKYAKIYPCYPVLCSFRWRRDLLPMLPSLHSRFNVHQFDTYLTAVCLYLWPIWSIQIGFEMSNSNKLIKLMNCPRGINIFPPKFHLVFGVFFLQWFMGRGGKGKIIFYEVVLKNKIIVLL